MNNKKPTPVDDQARQRKALAQINITPSAHNVLTGSKKAGYKASHLNDSKMNSFGLMVSGVLLTIASVSLISACLLTIALAFGGVSANHLLQETSGYMNRTPTVTTDTVETRRDPFFDKPSPGVGYRREWRKPHTQSHYWHQRHPQNTYLFY